MARHRHRLDLLPLLDVFMVVLFVFATIQEQRLDDSTHDAETLRAQAAELEQTMEEQQQTITALRAQEHVNTQRQQQDTATVAAEVQTLRATLSKAQDNLQQLRSHTRDALEQLGAGDDDLRRQDVLAKLLDQHSVFEVEIAGKVHPDHTVTNHCCYRADPLAGSWQSCGIIPLRADDLGTWLDSPEAAGLVAVLRRTKGGNAMTILRHNDDASFVVGEDLGPFLRERFRDHQIYVGVSVVDMRCSQ